MTSGSSPIPLTHPPQAKGVPPWERISTLPNPDDPQTRVQAERWHRAATNFDATHRNTHRRRRRAERAAIRRQRQREEMQQKLETNARRMYYIGFFFLPLVWLIGLIYFHREHRAPNASPIIKKCTSYIFSSCSCYPYTVLLRCRRGVIPLSAAGLLTTGFGLMVVWLFLIRLQEFSLDAHCLYSYLCCVVCRLPGLQRYRPAQAQHYLLHWNKSEWFLISLLNIPTCCYILHRKNNCFTRMLGPTRSRLSPPT